MAETPQQLTRGRFAPTPSGRMHLGNLFCALLAWLAAKKENGVMILRNEDLDPERCSTVYAEQTENDLIWLGLDWEEGGRKGGPNPPYSQSERSDIYEYYFNLLMEKQLLYPCFCSRAELHSAQAPHLSDGRVIYNGKCSQLTEDEVSALEKKRRPAWRLRVPDKSVSFIDMNCGPYQENLQSCCGDFILRRSDGVFSYQLAVVVDDALMQVNQVVRGEDLLSSSPRQIYLHEILGFQPPAFGHIPILTAEDGRRLSKREKDLDTGALRDRYRPEELIGHLAYLSGIIEYDEPVLARELIPVFSWQKLKHGELCVPEKLW